MYHEIYQRELKWMEQIRMSVYIFGETIGSFLKVLLLLFLPVSLLETVIIERVSRASEYFLQVVVPITEHTGIGVDSQMTEAIMHLLSQELLLYLLILFLQPVGIVAVSKMVKQYVDEASIHVGRCILEALECMPAILLSGIFWGILMLFAYILIVPGIYFDIAWSFYLCCIALDGKAGWAALESSKRLVQGKWWQTLGYLCLLGIMSFCFQSVFLVSSTWIGNEVIAEYLYHFLCYLSIGFVAVCKCVFFLNRKAVTEGNQNTFILEEVTMPPEVKLPKETEQNKDDLNIE